MPGCISVSTSRKASSLPKVAYWLPQLQHQNAFHTSAASALGLRLRQDQYKQIVSRKKEKRTRSSPSKALRQALAVKHPDYPLPAPKPQKVDVSYVNVRTAGKSRFREELARQHQQIGRRAKDPELSLQTILAKYIDVVYQTHLPQHEVEANPLSETTRLAALPEDSRIFLAAKGYVLDDLRKWASIIMTKNVQLGSEKFLEHVTVGMKGEEEVYKPLPSFLFLMFLQRNDIGPTALRYLLVYAGHQLQRKQHIQLSASGSSGVVRSASSVSPKYPALDDSTMFIMIIRLIRHARQTWPAALIGIAGMVTANIGYSQGMLPSETARRKERVNLQRIEYLYNQTLVLLSHPSPLAPFHAVGFQETAQFDILQRMATHRPPLAVTLNGYRAIATVQLKKKKTPRERDWAQLKAKSWPPWKDDKTGLDADKGPEYGVSRALQAIHRMHEAGYKGGLWEKVAQILSGWDVDGSPTIQTRAIHLHESSVKDMALNYESPHEIFHFDRDHVMIWAARVRTTRTVQEAWACFLAWQDRDLRPHQDVYFAMFEKIHYEDQRRRAEAKSLTNGISRSDAGDAREVFPIPESPKENTYVRVHPPTLNDLATEMFSKGVMPQGRCLIFLIQNAPNLGNGLRYIEWATQIDKTLSPLLTFDLVQTQAYHQVSEPILTAFVKLLNRSSIVQFHRVLSRRNITIEDVATAHFYADPLTYCFHLLKTRKLRYRPAWHILLQSLTRPNADLDVNQVEEDPGKQQINRYRLIRLVLAEMRGTGLEVDAETVRILCVGLGQTIMACLDILDRDVVHQKVELPAQELPSTTLANKKESAERQEDKKPKLPGTVPTGISSSPISPEALLEATKILQECRPLICKLFYKLMGTKNTGAPDFNGLSQNFDTPTHPTLLAQPNPQVLHGLFRVLGLLRSWHALVELLQWMVVFQKEVIAATEMPRNGPRSLRKVIVAIRVFCERSWLSQDLDDYSGNHGTPRPTIQSEKVDSAAPRKTINNIRKQIESVEGWGGWPSDEEVREYCKLGQFPRK